MIIQVLGPGCPRCIKTEENVKEAVKEKASELGAIATQMTGSGPTVFACCDDLKTAINVYKGLKTLSSSVFCPVPHQIV